MVTKWFNKPSKSSQASNNGDTNGKFNNDLIISLSCQASQFSVSFVRKYFYAMCFEAFKKE